MPVKKYLIVNEFCAFQKAILIGYILGKGLMQYIYKKKAKSSKKTAFRCIILCLIPTHSISVPTIASNCH